MKNVGLLMVLCLTSLHALAADPVPSNRLPYGGRWEGLVGVAGGIPNRTTVFTTLSPGATAAQINSAISSCPSNQVVRLNAGTYNLDGSIVIAKNGVTLRGATNNAGEPTTILNFLSANGGCIMIGSLNGWDAGNPGNWTTVDVSSGVARGSTTVNCATTPSSLQVGQIMWISAPSSPEVTGGGWSSFFGNRPFTQVVKVTGKSGNSVSFTPAINADYLSGVIQISWRAPANTIRLSGAENVSLTRSGAGAHYINTQGTDECWILNVKTYEVPSGVYHTYIYCCNRFEMRRCNMSHMQSLTSSTYCILSVHSSNLLIENNMFHDAPNIFPMMGVSGSVFAYNYITNLPYNPANWLSQIVFPHGSHNHYNLLEGNWLPESSIDAGGGSRGMLWFRNRMLAWDGNGPKTGNCHALMTEGNQNYMTMAAGVLGKAGFHTAYNGSGAAIYYIAASDDATLARLGNYNTFNGGVPANESIGANQFVTSYIHSSKPAWFGNLPWPPIDPGNYAQANQATNIPAGHRYVLGYEPASGPVNRPPVAVANASVTSGLPPLVVAFSSAGSFDPEGTALSYSWSFGDGGVSTAANPSHTYSADGNYPARLTVSDGTNTTQSSVLNILVGNQPPVPQSSATPSIGVAPLVVSFSSAGSIDPEGSPLTYLWRFGDGGTSTAANPTRTYSATGIYSATLTVSDGSKSAASTNVITVLDLASTLVAGYGFEEGSGAVAGDSSGHGNPGSISGATWAATGKFGKALSFSSGARVTVNDSSWLDLSGTLTLEAWVYPISQSSVWKNLIMKPNGDPSMNAPSYVLQGSSPSAAVPSFYFSSASGNITAPSALPLNTWSHVAATFDGTTARLFINGTQVASQAQTGTIAASIDPLTIGGNSYSGQSWTGLIDEVRVYNRALTAVEILTDMNLPVVSGATALQPPNGLHVVGQ